jgi:hypothetical protein
MLDLTRVVNNPLLCQSFTILRSTGQQGPGGWINQETSLTAYGVISVARYRDLLMIPEGDRTTGAMVFHSSSPMYLTRIGANQGISDILLWRGEQYKVSSVAHYEDYGYYSATAVRMLGA